MPSIRKELFDILALENEPEIVRYVITGRGDLEEIKEKLDTPIGAVLQEIGRVKREYLSLLDAAAERYGVNTGL